MATTQAQMSHALVVGGTGIFGSARVEKLVAAGWQNTSLSCGRIPGASGAGRIRADLTDPQPVFRVLAWPGLDQPHACLLHRPKLQAHRGGEHRRQFLRGPQRSGCRRPAVGPPTAWRGLAHVGLVTGLKALPRSIRVLWHRSHARHPLPRRQAAAGNT